MRKPPSAVPVKEVIKLDAFKDINQYIVSTTGTESQMTTEYLKDVSTMPAIVSAVREGNLKRHFSAEQEIVRLKFAFDHINCARYNTYQHVYSNNLLRKDKIIAKYLISNGYGTSGPGDSFSTIHGNLVTEHFNKETKGTAGPFRPGYSTDIYAVNKWIKTSHIHCKMRKMLRKKLKVFTSQVHKEMTPGNKRLHFEKFSDP